MYLRANTKQKSKTGVEFKGLLFMLAGFFLCYCLVLPAQAGAVGQFTAKISFLLFGKAAFAHPALIFWWGYVMLRPSIQLTWRLDVIWGVLFLCTLSSFSSLVGNVFYHVNYGGWTGLKLSPFFRRIFGPYFSIFVTGILAAYLVSLMLRVSMRKLIVSLWQKLVEDYKAWEKARQEYKNQTAPKIKNAEPNTAAKN